MKKQTKKEIIIDPEFSERKLDGYYFIEMYCSNCEKPTGMYKGGIDVMIRCGKQVPLVSLRCPNCECITLQK